MEINICRICYSEKGCYDIFDHKLSINNDIILMSDALSLFSTLQMDIEDNMHLTKMLCDECTQELGIAYQFFIKVQASEEKCRTEFVPELINAEDEFNENSFDSSDVIPIIEESDDLHDINFDDYVIIEKDVEKEIEKEIEEKIESIPIIKQKTKFNRIPNIQLSNNVASIIKNVSVLPIQKILKRKSSKHKIETETDSKRYKTKNCIVVPQFVIQETKTYDLPAINMNATMDEDAICEQLIGYSKPKTTTPCLHKATLNVTAIGLENEQLDIYANLTKKEDSSTMYMCKYCPKAFSSPYHLGLHTKKTHICQYCLNSFAKIADLHKHVKTEHNSFECSLCGRKFTNNSNLRAHMRRNHDVFLPAHVSLITLPSKME